MTLPDWCNSLFDYLGRDCASRGLTVAVASGKGGTGKTTLATNLAAYLAAQGEKVTLLDCDVEEPNCRLFLAGGETTTTEVKAPKPICDTAACTQCGACVDACHFNALALARQGVLVFDELCHACGVCFQVCPAGALKLREALVGEVRVSSSPFPLIDGLLGVGQPSGGPVIWAVRKHATREGITIIDAAPGTACAVVEGVRGVDLLLLVTEPTPFGLHDLRMAVDLAAELGLPAGIIINRSFGHDELIERFAAESGVPVLGRIPFRREYAMTISAGRLANEAHPEFSARIAEIAETILEVKPTRPAGRVRQEGPVADPSPSATPDANPAQIREILVISGKGGTGKTTVTAAFSTLAEGHAYADTDVDAPNLHLVLGLTPISEEGVSAGVRATLVGNRCNGCGLCARECRFDAIAMEGSDDDMTVRVPIVNATACEGCGLCVLICPEKALQMRPVETGWIHRARAACGPLAYARLNAGRANSGKLATRVRHEAQALAREYGRKTVLIDGPPGIGCPTIASLTGSTRAVVVTEPTVSAAHDLMRALDLAGKFRIPACVIINKADINPEQAAAIRRTAEHAGAAVLGEIPFDPLVQEAIAAGHSVIAHGDGPAARALRSLWQELNTSVMKGEVRR